MQTIPSPPVRWTLWGLAEVPAAHIIMRSKLFGAYVFIGCFDTSSSSGAGATLDILYKIVAKLELLIFRLKIRSVPGVRRLASYASSS